MATPQWAAAMPPQDPRQQHTNAPPVSIDDEFIVINEVEWADDKDVGGELAPRPKLDKHSDPCGCKPDADGGPCCNDMSCVLFACQEECRSNCEAGNLCCNKRITHKEWKQVQVFDAGVKGKGLRALEPIKKGDFIAEYVGRAIRKGYLDMLFKRYRNERMLYIMALDQNTYIDARKKGGIARYINHSCEPNCIVERWKVKGILRAGIFALKDIAVGEELSFDYKWDRKRGRAPTKCHCLSPTCRGTLEVPKSMEEDELERRLMGHWKKPDSLQAGNKIINRSIKILSEQHHEYFSADVCKYDETTGKHLVIYRHGLEEVWEDLLKEDWMILDEEAEQFVIAKKSQPMAASPSRLLGPAGLALPFNGQEEARPVKNYMFIQTPVKEQIIGRHLIERCQRNCHVTIDITKCINTYETPLPDDQEGLELQRTFELSKDNIVWKLTITGFNTDKAYFILEKNVDSIEKSIHSEASGGTALSGSATQGMMEEVIIPRCVVEQVKRRLPEIREKCRSVNVTFAHSDSKSKQFSRLVLDAALVSDLQIAKLHVWTKLVEICSEEKAPVAPSGIYKDLGFLGGELSGDKFRLLLSDEDNETLSQECAEDLRRSPFFSSFEGTNQCTVWVQSLEDKGRIDKNNLIVVNEGVPNAPRKVYFGSAPSEIPKLWSQIQKRADELERGVRYMYLGADRIYQQQLKTGDVLFDYIERITGVSVSLDAMTGDHLRFDGSNSRDDILGNLPSSESGRVSLAEDIVKLQIELYRDHSIRQQNWIFGRDWTSINTAAFSSRSESTRSSPGKLPATPRHSPPASRSQFEARSVANACIEIADIVSNLGLSANVAAHAAIIMYRFVTVISNEDFGSTQLKVRELLLGCVLLANKSQKTVKWKRMDALLEAAYETFYPGSTFNSENEEVVILERRVMGAEAEILGALNYDIFWRGTDWIFAAVTGSYQMAEPLAKNALDLTLSGSVLAAGPKLWLTCGAEYAFAAIAGFLSVDLQKLTSSLSLIPLKVSMAAEIIANSIKSTNGGRRNSSHTFFTAGGSEALLKQLQHIKSTCIDLTNKLVAIPGMGSRQATSESVKMYEIIGRRDNRQRIFRGVPTTVVREQIIPIIDWLCADSNCKIFVSENKSGVGNDIILQGSWRPLAIAENLVRSFCELDLSHKLPEAVDCVASRDLSSSMQAKVYPGVMNMSVVHTTDGWNDTIQSKFLGEGLSLSHKVGGKSCLAGKVSEDSVRDSGLRWWVPPRYAPSPSGAICDMFAVRENAVDFTSGGDIGALAKLARDLAGEGDSLKLFPSLMTFYSGSNGDDKRYMAVSLQRWPSEKVSNREKRMNKNSPIGVSPSALQEMELLNQLHSLIPSPRGHPNFVLPIAVSLTPEEAASHDSPEKLPGHSFEPEKGTDEIFSLFRSSEDNEKVAQKEKKKRNDLATGAHLVFHPTPFVLQRFTTRSRSSSGESSGDQILAPSLLKAWFHDLLSALTHCHENHVVLRTLQPDQILIDHSGVAKIGGLYRATVLPYSERQESPNALKIALKNARSRRSKSDETEEASSSYIAPELLLGSTKHTKESDVWSMGCLFAHLLLHKPLFVGKDRASLLLAIFKIAGIPYKDNYPEAKEFPFYTEPPKKYKRGVVSALHHMLGAKKAQEHANEIDLLDRMLHLDPKKRITASDALKHECMVEFIETCSSDEYRKQYVNDWLALKKRFLQARKLDEEDARKQESSMKRKALLMVASTQDPDDDGDDDLYGDLLGGNKGDKRHKGSE